MFTAKYSTTTPTNALRPTPGNVAISVDAGEDGPTSTTGWYNGFKIPEGGYLVIQSTSGNDPDYFPIANDTEMINLAKYTFGQSSISQVRDSLFYFLNNANTIVLDRIPNNIVTADAFLNIDMSVLASFPSTERAILDLSGNQAVGRVNNAPSYKPDPGVLDFDGTDENITYSSPLCAGLDAWSWQSTVAFDVIQGGATSPYYQLYIEEFAIWIAQYANAVGIDMRQDGASWFDGNGGTNTGAQIGLGNILPGLFNHFTWTLEQPDLLRGYFNGELEVTIPTNQNGPIATGQDVTCIASRYGSRFFDGQMRDTKTYASTLTEEQVRQNYHLAPIVTNGLVFAMDAGNLVSYNPGDTTAFSLCPSNIKQNNPLGALTNGTAWNKRGNGTWTFDGNNDFIDGNPIPSTTGDNSRTTCIWFKSTANENTALFDKGSTGNGLAEALYIANANGVGSSPPSNPGGVYVVFWNQDFYIPYGSTNMFDGEWHFVAYSYDSSSSSLRICIDGEFPQTVYKWNSAWTTQTSQPFSLNLNLNTPSNNYWIGRSRAALWGIGDTYANGDISKVLHYNRALSETEMVQNFEANRNRFGL